MGRIRSVHAVMIASEESRRVPLGLQNHPFDAECGDQSSRLGYVARTNVDGVGNIRTENWLIDWIGENVSCD